MSRVDASSDAVNNPVKRAYNRETNSAEQALRPLPAIESRDDLDGEFIVSTEQLAAKDYLDELAFNEEMLTIFLHRGREKFAPQVIDLHVNGKAVWIPVEQNVNIKRKYVEVMARSQPMDVRTESYMLENSQDAGTVNRINRSLSANYSFSVLHDPSPKGPAWLAKVMREA